MGAQGIIASLFAKTMMSVAQGVGGSTALLTCDRPEAKGVQLHLTLLY